MMKKWFCRLFALVFALLIAVLLLLCGKYGLMVMGREVPARLDGGVDILLLGVFLAAIPLKLMEKRLFPQGKELPGYVWKLRWVTLLLAAAALVLILISIF